MALFIERYILAVAAALTVLIVFTNPWKLDWPQRVSGGLAVILAAYFAAHTAQLLNRHKDKSASQAAPTESTAPVTPAPSQSGAATTSGAYSPAVTGDGNTINIGVPTTLKASKRKTK